MKHCFFSDLSSFSLFFLSHTLFCLILVICIPSCCESFVWCSFHQFLISLLFTTSFSCSVCTVADFLTEFVFKMHSAVWVWTVWQKSCLRASISFLEASLSSAHYSQTIFVSIPGGPPLQTELHPHITALRKGSFYPENLWSKYWKWKGAAKDQNIIAPVLQWLSWEFNSGLVKLSPIC